MKNISSTCRLIVVCAVALLGCLPGRSLERKRAKQPATPPREAAVEKVTFDPLGWPGDTVPVIAQTVDSGIAARVVSRAQASVAAGDTTHHRVYRVQLITTETYNEGRQALRVAEEIFDQPVFLDYDTPNYKVRVGNFVKRQTADDYLRRAQSAGYPNAWVVSITVPLPGIKPAYDTLPGPAADTARGDTTSAGDGQ